MAKLPVFAENLSQKKIKKIREHQHMLSPDTLISLNLHQNTSLQCA